VSVKKERDGNSPGMENNEKEERSESEQSFFFVYGFFKIFVLFEFCLFNYDVNTIYL
jgi:hypothetical protein